MCGKFPISFMCGRSVVNTFSPTHTRVHECIRMYTTTHTFLFPHTHAHTHTHTQADKRRNRAKLIEFFADTALECRKLNNYNSYMAISGEVVGGER